MRSIGLFLLCFGVAASAEDLGTVRTVYIMSMAHGLDQYLANRLTSEHVYHVVTDPKVADAVITDHIGKGFEEQLSELLPPEAPKKPEPEPTAVEADKKKAAEPTRSLLLVDADAKLPNLALNSSFGRNKGTLFIVDPRSKQVLWSVYEEPKGGASKEMDRTASDIVSRLKKDLNLPKGK